jgi:hypothetical protein
VQGCRVEIVGQGTFSGQRILATCWSTKYPSVNLTLQSNSLACGQLIFCTLCKQCLTGLLAREGTEASRAEAEIVGSEDENAARAVPLM